MYEKTMSVYAEYIQTSFLSVAVDLIPLAVSFFLTLFAGIEVSKPLHLGNVQRLSMLHLLHA